MSHDYLTINQLAKACATSRSTLLRMEQDGILDPVYINPDNGYRYYDTSSVLRVSRNISLQELGVTHRELRDYYRKNDYSELIEKLMHKMEIMEYLLSHIKLQLRLEDHLSISPFYFPEIYCYTKTLKKLVDYSTVRKILWDTFNEVIHKGLSIDRQMLPFVQINHLEIAKNNYKNIGFDYEICIPVLPQKGIPQIKHFEGTNTMSAILYGGSADIKQAFAKLINETDKLNIFPNGPARVVTVTGPYPGENIPTEYQVERVCIPFK